MRKTLFILALALAAVTAIPRNQQRIVGGATVNINQYPFIAALLYSPNSNTYTQTCCGVIVNSRYILSVAHCIVGYATNRWRVRVGSALAGSGGTVYNFHSFKIHPSYNIGARNNNDIALLRTSSAMNLNNIAKSAQIASATYYLGDNQDVWAVGWGRTAFQGASSNQLRHVQIKVVNQNTCALRYRDLDETITENMVCAGVLDVGGRDHCHGDDGGPLLHNGVVVGIASWRERCALARYPGVNTRVSRFTQWIVDNAK